MQPAINVDWEEARSYAAWLSAHTGHAKPTEYRLLSEAEFEYAARAGTDTKYPWGDEIGVGNASCDSLGNRMRTGRCGSKWDGEKAAPVDAFPPNQFGLYDMHGNVWEWVEDCLHMNYEHAPDDGSAWTKDCVKSGNMDLRILRGGSWYRTPDELRSSARFASETTFRDTDVGFRVVRRLAK